MNYTTFLTLLAFLGLTAAVAAFGAMFQPGGWYQDLTKPGWTPPNWLFGPVWTILYIMIAIAGWLVWREQGAGALAALWTLQLIFNGAWSWIMFDQHQIGWAFADIGLMWGTIILFAIFAWPVAPAASLLFVPYLMWVTYAGALNFAIWRMNG